MSCQGGGTTREIGDASLLTSPCLFVAGSDIGSHIMSLVYRGRHEKLGVIEFGLTLVWFLRTDFAHSIAQTIRCEMEGRFARARTKGQCRLSE